MLCVQLMLARLTRMLGAKNDDNYSNKNNSLSDGHGYASRLCLLTCVLIYSCQS